MLEDAWRDEGYSVPNPGTYPWQWCWDSCFHAVVWSALEPPRAVRELQMVFSAQTADGFVPHMTYHADLSAAYEIWRQPGHSAITNPPIYGHALRVLHDAGVDLPDELLEAAGRGLEWLVTHRTRRDGLVVVCHPWETGCDDTPRWDGFLPAVRAGAADGDPGFDKAAWDRRKRDVLWPAVVRDGGIVANPAFEVAPASFNALVAFNLREFAEVRPSGPWIGHAERIEGALARRWNGTTWTDGEHPGADAPTLEAMLGVLVDPRDAVWEAVTDDDRHRGEFGLWQVDRRHPRVDPDGYWRGAAWAPLDYLFWVAARRQERHDIAVDLGRRFVRGAQACGLAEYWNPATGDGHGAQPQTWTGLALVVEQWLAAGAP
jgi:hypothetical protein